MHQHSRRWRMALTLVLMSGVWLGLLVPVAAQSSQRCFEATGACISGRIREVWEREGGLTVFGLPIGEQQQANFAGTPVTFQVFERQRIELHAEHAPPYDVLFGRVGAERLAQQGRDWWQFPRSEAKAGCQFFAETGHNVCAPFLAVWRAAGSRSLARFGLPLSDMQTETINGKQLNVQWFERARFEFHPENAAPFDVLFGLLSSEMAVGSTPPAAAPITPVAPVATAPGQPTSTPTATAAGASEPTETPRPASTRVPATAVPGQPTNTAVPATNPPQPSNTAVPATNPPQPSNTPIPPTNTPAPTATPTSPFQPPSNPQPPTGLPPFGGLPSNATTNINLSSLTAATSTLTVGVPVCFNLQDSEVPSSQNQVYTITGPGGTSQQVTLKPPYSRWRWAPRPGWPEGVYTITAAGNGYGAGTPVTTAATGTFTLKDASAGATPGNDGRVVAVQANASINSAAVNSCNDGTYGAPGDNFELLLTGFSPNEAVDLYVYGTPGCTQAAKACFIAQLPPITVDAKGQAIVPFPSKDTDPKGRYVIVKKSQTLTLDADGNFAGSLEQRITLDPIYK